jgi:hypothetical protein
MELNETQQTGSLDIWKKGSIIWCASDNNLNDDDSKAK